VSLEETWKELESETLQQSQGMLAKRIPLRAACGLLVGIRAPDRRRTLRLEIAATAIPAGMATPAAEGFEIDIEYDAPRRQAAIVVACAAVGSHEVFAAFAESLVRSVTRARTGEECVHALLDRIQVWQNFFRLSRGYLGPDARAGLVGELHVLRSMILPAIGAERALAAWVGPTKTQQDFHCSRAAVEVKTTRGEMPGRIRVSSARQLDPVSSGRLLLVVVYLSVTADGGTTLPELVSEVRAQLASHGDATLMRFDDLLVRQGYLDIHESVYAAEHYSIRHVNGYDVLDEFPTVREASLPTGVSDLQYSLDLSACAPFAMSLAEVTNAIEEPQ
jgi:hypothetical protein